MPAKKKGSKKPPKEKSSWKPRLPPLSERTEMRPFSVKKSSSKKSIPTNVPKIPNFPTSTGLMSKASPRNPSTYDPLAGRKAKRGRPMHSGATKVRWQSFERYLGSNLQVDFNTFVAEAKKRRLHISTGQDGRPLTMNDKTFRQKITRCVDQVKKSKSGIITPKKKLGRKSDLSEHVKGHLRNYVAMCADMHRHISRERLKDIITFLVRQNCGKTPNADRLRILLNSLGINWVPNMNMRDVKRTEAEHSIGNFISFAVGFCALKYDKNVSMSDILEKTNAHSRVDEEAAVMQVVGADKKEKKTEQRTPPAQGEDDFMQLLLLDNALQTGKAEKPNHFPANVLASDTWSMDVTGEKYGRSKEQARNKDQYRDLDLATLPGHLGPGYSYTQKPKTKFPAGLKLAECVSTTGSVLPPGVVLLAGAGNVRSDEKFVETPVEGLFGGGKTQKIFISEGLTDELMKRIFIDHAKIIGKMGAGCEQVIVLDGDPTQIRMLFTKQIRDLCKKLKISVLKLPSNLSHLIQLLDVVSSFRDLKRLAKNPNHFKNIFGLEIYLALEKALKNTAAKPSGGGKASVAELSGKVRMASEKLTKMHLVHPQAFAPYKVVATAFNLGMDPVDPLQILKLCPLWRTYPTDKKHFILDTLCLFLCEMRKCGQILDPTLRSLGLLNEEEEQSRKSDSDRNDLQVYMRRAVDMFHPTIIAEHQAEQEKKEEKENAKAQKAQEKKQAEQKLLTLKHLCSQKDVRPTRHDTWTIACTQCKSTTRQGYMVALKHEMKSDTGDGKTDEQQADIFFKQLVAAEFTSCMYCDQFLLCPFCKYDMFKKDVNEKLKEHKAICPRVPAHKVKRKKPVSSPKKAAKQQQVKAKPRKKAKKS